MNNLRNTILFMDMGSCKLISVRKIKHSFHIASQLLDAGFELVDIIYQHRFNPFKRRIVLKYEKTQNFQELMKEAVENEEYEKAEYYKNKLNGK